MVDIDQVLRDALHCEAAPVDAAQVVDAIRTRVAAGDVGTTAGAGGPFPGGGHLPGWLGAGVLAIAVGGTLGFTGLLGQDAEAVPSPTGGDLRQDAVGLHCPAGQQVVSFRAGDRVYAVSRTADSAWLGVRSPFDRSRVVWVDAAQVVADAGAGALAELPEGGCDQGQARALGRSTTPVKPKPTQPTEPVETDSPTPDAGPAPGPEPKQPKPKQPTTTQPPAPVNQAPKVTSIKASGSPFCGGPAAQITVHAGDDTGVTRVRLTWTGADNGSANMTRIGDVWKHTYLPPGSTFGDVTFTARAYDAAGRASGTKSDTVYVDCLI